MAKVAMAVIQKRRISVPAMPLAGKDHGQPAFVRRRDHLVVAHRPARQNHAGCACLGGRVQPVAEREERVGGAGAADRPPCLLYASRCV